jgi:hypothetical protein
MEPVARIAKRSQLQRRAWPCWAMLGHSGPLLSCACASNACPAHLRHVERPRHAAVPSSRGNEADEHV